MENKEKPVDERGFLPGGLGKLRPRVGEATVDVVGG